MKKLALYYKCPKGHESPFEKPTGSISPDENKGIVFAADCPYPECNHTDIFTFDEIKKALENPEPPEPQKPKWEWFWK